MRTALRAAWIVAAAVCVMTFGVMTTFWYVLPQNQRIPGHWDYASGTLGDAAVLPLLAGALTFAVRTLQPARRDFPATALAGIVGLVGGAAVQFSWLADPDPRLNWVVPRAHHFSVPGWYHAVVLVVLSIALSGAYGLLLSRLSGASAGAARSIRWPVAMFSGAITVFLFLVILDSTPSATTSSSTTTILICAGGIAAATLPILLVAGAQRRAVYPHLLLGLLAGVVVDLVVVAVRSLT